MTFSKISIVTPNYNLGEFLEKTILSVINQGYPNLEYIIIDGGSTDNSLDIIRKYEKHLKYWVSEADNGLYDALNKGFKMASGDIMGWVNSDDIYYPNSFFLLNKIFNDLPAIHWVQGLNSFIDLDDIIFKTKPPRKFSYVGFLNHDFKWVQQESTFWRKGLWERSGSQMNSTYKLAGDFDLWLRFARLEKLYNAAVPLGAFRVREGQLSGAQLDNYVTEVKQILSRHVPNPDAQRALNKLRKNARYLKYLSWLKIFNRRLLKRRDHLLEIEHLNLTYSFRDKRFELKGHE